MTFVMWSISYYLLYKNNNGEAQWASRQWCPPPESPPNLKPISAPCWLVVVYPPLWKMMDFVSWDDYSQPNISGKMPKSWQPVTTNQLCIILSPWKLDPISSSIHHMFSLEVATDIAVQRSQHKTYRHAYSHGQEQIYNTKWNRFGAKTHTKTFFPVGK